MKHFARIEGEGHGRTRTGGSCLVVHLVLEFLIWFWLRSVRESCLMLFGCLGITKEGVRDEDGSDGWAAS